MTRQSGMADRDPCPWRIVDDIGGAFCMGAIGGGIWHTVRGAWTAPAHSRLKGSVSAVGARAPVLGGQFAVWGAVFSCCDCTLTAIRQKEDPWNSIVSGAATGGILASRAGPRAMATSAAVGGVLLALIEGMGIMLGKAFAPPVPTAEDYAQASAQAQAAMDPTAPPTQGGLFPSSGGGSMNPFGSSGGSSGEVTAPPSSSGGFGMETTFTTEGGGDSSSSSSSYSNTVSSSDAGNASSSSSSSSGGWWPFGSSSSSSSA